MSVGGESSVEQGGTGWPGDGLINWYMAEDVDTSF